MANCEPLSGIVFYFRHDPGAVVLAATKGNVSWFKLRCPPGTFAEDLACKHCPPGFHCAGSGLDGDAVALPLPPAPLPPETSPIATDRTDGSGSGPPSDRRGRRAARRAREACSDSLGAGNDVTAIQTL